MEWPNLSVTGKILCGTGVTGAVNVTSVITVPRTVLVGQTVYLFCQVEGPYETCGWINPLVRDKWLAQYDNLD